MKVRTDIRRLAYEAMPISMREHAITREYVYALVQASQEKNSLPYYSGNKTYNPGDRVSFKFRSYEVPDNSTTQGGFSGEMPIVDNQLNTPYWNEIDLRTVDQINREAIFLQSWTSQVIYLEHYLNATLNNNSIDPYSKNSYIGSNPIYIEDISDREYSWVFKKSTWPVFFEDEFYVFPKWDSAVAYSSGDQLEFKGGIYEANQATNAGESPSTHPSKWDYIRKSRWVFQKSYYTVQSHYIVWVPNAVKNTLTNPTDVVRDRVDRYNLAGVKYEVKYYN